MNENDVAIRLEHVSKSFYGSKALVDVNLEIYKGEVHIICGENGAGKSTLMKILSGIYSKDEGTVSLFGEEYAPTRPIDAERKGVVTIHQESNLSRTNSVAENIFLHREPGKFLINIKEMHKKARNYLDQVGCKVSTRENTELLSPANQQLVQIAKALSQDAKVLIMDEPVSSISEEDTVRLFKLINALKKEGLTVIYIDHRIDNFKLIGDRVSVLRDGKMVGTSDLCDLTKDDIIRMMVGRDVENIYTKSNSPENIEILSIKNYNNGKLKNIELSVKKGEVFGLAGLVGAGRSEIVRAIFGIDPVDPGAEIRVRGKQVKIKTPKDAVRNHIAFIPEDRKGMGIIPGRSIVFNLIIAFVSKLGRFGIVDSKIESRVAKKQIDELQIKALNLDTQVKELSGGNQQKVVIGKWLMRDDTELILMDEPTRGIDVGVKMEIYKLIDRLTANGKSVLLITSEMSELIGMCDRIATIKEGTVVKIFNRDEFSQEAILKECI
jgi:ABC-type sugar transport system ATPase subunit